MTREGDRRCCGPRGAAVKGSICGLGALYRASTCGRGRVVSCDSRASERPSTSESECVKRAKDVGRR